MTTSVRACSHCGHVGVAAAEGKSIDTVRNYAGRGGGEAGGRNSPEQLIVASNDVAASTAQLVAASRVKASFMSKTQDRLEAASKTVTQACRALVRQVQQIINERNQDGDEAVDYSKLSGHEFKVREMEQQVEILQLENALSSAPGAPGGGAADAVGPDLLLVVALEDAGVELLAEGLLGVFGVGEGLPKSAPTSKLRSTLARPHPSLSTRSRPPLTCCMRISLTSPGSC